VSVEPAYIEQPKLRYAWLWWSIGWILVVLTINDSLERHPPQFLNVFYSDKLLHFSGYFALATWFGGVTRRARYLVVAAGLLALGGGIEIAQGLMHNGREADWWDFVANALGVTTGLVIAYAGLGRWMIWVEHFLRPQR
jgi:VanZ family protein